MGNSNSQLAREKNLLDDEEFGSEEEILCHLGPLVCLRQGLALKKPGVVVLVPPEEEEEQTLLGPLTNEKEFLQQRGLFVEDIHGQEDETPFYGACRHGQFSVVQLLLEHGADPQQAVVEMHLTPLHGACISGHWEVVSLLLDQGGVPVDQPDDRGDTALLTAAGMGHDAIVGLLLARGAQVHVRNHRRYTALHQACQWGVLEAATFDQRWALLQVLLQHAAAAGVAADVVNARTAQGRTPLFLLCNVDGLVSEEQVALLTILLDHGAVDGPDIDGQTALMVASSSGQAALVELLLQRGGEEGVLSRVNQANKGGRTALYLASTHQHGPVVQLLRQYGAVLDPAADEADGVGDLTTSSSSWPNRGRPGSGSPDSLRLLISEHGTEGEEEEARELKVMAAPEDSEAAAPRCEKTTPLKTSTAGGELARAAALLPVISEQ